MTEPAYSRLARERRVADVMRTARNVFDEKGHDAASVAEIAARAGVVEGSVYRDFEHKRALRVEVVERWDEELLADHDEHLAVTAGTCDRLRYLVWKHVRGEATFSPDVTSDAIIEILRAGLGIPPPAAQPGFARTVSQPERVAARLERTTRKPSRTHVSKAARRKSR